MSPPAGQLHAADLNAAVRAGHSVLALQLEVRGRAAAPDEKCVLREAPIGRAFADDRAVLDPPERRIAVPSLQRRSVEDRLEAGVIVEHELGRSLRLRQDRAPAMTSAAITMCLMAA